MDRPEVPLGDSTTAGVAHEVELWRAAAGIPPIDAGEVLRSYAEISGL